MKIRRMKRKITSDMVKLAKSQYFVPLARWVSTQQKNASNP